MKKVIVFLTCFFIVFLISGEKLATFDNIFKPYRFQVDGDDLYVVDGPVIKLFSMKDFKLVTQFGKKGEGPGEFKRSAQIMVFPDKVVAVSSGKVSFFTRGGEIISEKKLPIRINVNKVKENYLGMKYNFDRKKLTSDVSVKVLNNDFQTIKEIDKYTYPEGDFLIFASGLKTKLKLNMVLNYYNAITDGNYIYIGNTTKGLYIDIFNHDGNKVNTINKKYKKLKVSEEFKKKRMDELKRSKNWERDKKMFNHVFPDYFPAFRNFRVNNGKIYVFTHLEKEKERQLIILDIHGKKIKETFIPRERYFSVCNNKFYYFVDNEDEEVMEFHSIDL